MKKKSFLAKILELFPKKSDYPSNNSYKSDMTSEQVQEDYGFLTQEEYRSRKENKAKFATNIPTIEIESIPNEELYKGEIILENDYPASFVFNEVNYEITFHSPETIVQKENGEEEELGSSRSENIGYFAYVEDYLVRFMQVDGEWQVQDTRFMPEPKSVEA